MCGGVQEQRYEKVDRRMKFIANRDKLYNQEAACLSKFIEGSGLPEGWSAVKSNTFPGEFYFFNHESGESTCARRRHGSPSVDIWETREC